MWTDKCKIFHGVKHELCSQIPTPKQISCFVPQLVALFPSIEKCLMFVLNLLIQLWAICLKLRELLLQAGYCLLLFWIFCASILAKVYTKESRNNLSTECMCSYWSHFLCSPVPCFCLINSLPEKVLLILQLFQLVQSSEINQLWRNNDFNQYKCCTWHSIIIIIIFSNQYLLLLVSFANDLHLLSQPQIVSGQSLSFLPHAINPALDALDPLLYLCELRLCER